MTSTSSMHGHSTIDKISCQCSRELPEQAVDFSLRQRQIESGAPGTRGDGSGVSGNPTRATAEYGEQIMELQIDAAVRQIQRFRETSRVSR